MGITRQAVYKVTKELQRMDILRLEEDPSDRRQKIICMTPLGETIALDARASLIKDWGPIIQSLDDDSLGKSKV